MILAHGALRTLTATSLVSLVDGAISNITCIFVSDICDSRKYEALRSTIYLTHIILLRYSLILNKMLMMCLKSAATSNLTRGVKRVASCGKHECLFLMLI